MFKALLTSLLIATLSLNAAAAAAPAARQAQVREKGAEVMPFSLDRTVHTFDKTPDGGVQRVRTRGDAVEQLERIRMHLRQIARSFAEHDFSQPMHIHGESMPGLAALRAARPGELEVSYHELDDGAEVDYVAHTPTLVAAIHEWFDAQLADHGTDATTSASRPPLAEFAWLAGTWRLRDRDRIVEEFWSAPAADLMIGMSRTLRDGRTREFEFVRIAARADGVFYIAQPEGRPAVEFKLQNWDGRTAVFAATTGSDRLKRIIYRHDGAAAMTARIEGSTSGADFAQDFAYRRVTPDASNAPDEHAHP
jgi:hypothetical protein